MLLLVGAALSGVALLMRDRRLAAAGCTAMFRGGRVTRTPKTIRWLAHRLTQNLCCLAASRPQQAQA